MNIIPFSNYFGLRIRSWEIQKANDCTISIDFDKIDTFLGWSLVSGHTIWMLSKRRFSFADNEFPYIFGMVSSGDIFRNRR